MRKKGMVASFLTALCCSVGFSCSAGVINLPINNLMADIDYNMSKIEIDGDVNAKSGVYSMTYTVTDKTGGIIYMDETKELEPDGSFGFTFTAPTNQTEDAVYSLDIGGHYAIENPLVITVYGTESRNTELNTLKGLSGSDFSSRLENTATYFSLDITDAKVTNELYDAVAVAVESKKDELTISNFKEAVRKDIIFQMFKTEHEKITHEILEEYNDILNIDISEGSYFEKLEDKTPVYKYVAKKAEKTEDIKSVFDEAVMIVSFDSMSRTEMDGLLKEYADVIDSDYMSVYDGFSAYKKAEVAIALEKADVASLADIKSVFEEAVEKNNTESGGGYGGGSFGGGGGGGYSAPAIPTSNIPVSSVAITGFKDISDYPWAVEGITYLSEKGIVNGESETSFNPGGTVTRAQLVKMLVNAFNIPSAKERYNFSDVKADNWAYDYICRAYENGLINGYGDGKIGANDPVTRQDMAVLVYRFADKFGNKAFDTNSDDIFSDDAKIAGYAKDGVYAMKNSGVINGVGENRFSPAENCSRAMAAKVVYELIK